ncbi:MAG: class I SAM-dependent methyltransferase [Casimicrobiaceae bacterium]
MICAMRSIGASNSRSETAEDGATRRLPLTTRKMQQTPAHDLHNPDLLALMPRQSTRIVEIGSSSGALARAFKAANPGCHYTGVEIDPAYGRSSQRYCDFVLNADIEDVDDAAFDRLFPSDCWVFGDALEHLKDPWRLLRKIRDRISIGGSVVACIPNAQHWSLQARLNCGMFEYEDSGLLDRTHLRWFTRITIMELFRSSDFKIVEGRTRTPDEPAPDSVLRAIRVMAQATGTDQELAVHDAIPFQWLVRATPA